MDDGSCRGGDPDALFVRGAEQNVAKQVCRTCPVRTECLSDALDSRTEFGVWGGMTERERRALLRRRPEVRSWTQLLLAARDEHLAGADVPGPRVSPPRVSTARPAGRLSA
ncbi:WhiB family transcriptional regulator [uncultured Pseudokineococcus sp.]|uniref:WhiB family transcriptional regulator n=1 Tax=uncultured Pseudokineococcus sp. TaxID=1642928 RepID=UPI00343D6E40